MTAPYEAEGFWNVFFQKLFVWLNGGGVIQLRKTIKASDTNAYVFNDNDSHIYPAFTCIAWPGPAVTGVAGGIETLPAANKGTVFVGKKEDPLIPLQAGQSYTFRWKSLRDVGYRGDGTSSDQTILLVS